MAILGNCVTGLFRKKSFPFDYMIISKYIIQHLYRVSLICAWHKHTIISRWLLAAKTNENNCTRCRLGHCYLIFNLQLSQSSVIWDATVRTFFSFVLLFISNRILVDCCYIVYRFLLKYNFSLASGCSNVCSYLVRSRSRLLHV